MSEYVALVERFGKPKGSEKNLL